MKHIKELNTYLANLALWNLKLHNLHWNVTGQQFMPVHQFTEALYEKAFQDFDAVAEHVKIKGFKPLVTTKEYLENATIKEVDYADFSTDLVLKTVKDDLELMKNLALKVRKLAEEENDYTAIGMLEGFVADFEKNLWFLRQMEV